MEKGWLIALIVWLVGIPVTYFLVTRKWNQQSKFEQIWYSFFWLVLPFVWLYAKLHDEWLGPWIKRMLKR